MPQSSFPTLESSTPSRSFCLPTYRTNQVMSLTSSNGNFSLFGDFFYHTHSFNINALLILPFPSLYVSIFACVQRSNHCWVWYVMVWVPSWSLLVWMEPKRSWALFLPTSGCIKAMTWTHCRFLVLYFFFISSSFCISIFTPTADGH